MRIIAIEACAADDGIFIFRRVGTLSRGLTPLPSPVRRPVMVVP